LKKKRGGNEETEKKKLETQESIFREKLVTKKVKYSKIKTAVKEKKGGRETGKGEKRSHLTPSGYCILKAGS